MLKDNPADTLLHLYAIRFFLYQNRYDMAQWALTRVARAPGEQQAEREGAQQRRDAGAPGRVEGREREQQRARTQGRRPHLDQALARGHGPAQHHGPGPPPAAGRRGRRAARHL